MISYIRFFLSPKDACELLLSSPSDTSGLSMAVPATTLVHGMGTKALAHTLAAFSAKA